VPEIQAGKELRSVPMDRIVPAGLPRASSDGGLLRLIYHLHNGF
jgi:hypothetical protein